MREVPHPPAAAPIGSTTTGRAPMACGNCGDAMQALRLTGHYQQTLEIDLCEPCHLVWFDEVEAARLSGPGMLALIDRMSQAQALPHRTLARQAACPRCRGALKTVHNRSRWGRSLQLECLQRHGAYQSFAQFLAEKGLVRPMTSADRAGLLARDGRIDCINCGGSIGQHDEACPYCLSVPSRFDVARLARALDPEGAIDAQAVHTRAADSSALQCMACGAAVDRTQPLQCGQCGATLAVSRLAEAHRQISTLGPALQAHAKQPAPRVVRQRLEVLAGDMPRQREWVERMRADTDRRNGRDDDENGFTLPWHIGSGRTQPLRAVFIALAIWFAWWYWG